MPRRQFETASILKLRGRTRRTVEDWVVVEEPLEIRVAGEPLAVIMRTPGHDVELACGFALTEGVVRSADEIGSVRQCRSSDAQHENVVEIGLVEGTAFDSAKFRRNLMASAACGLCGRASLDALASQARPVPDGFAVPRRVIESLPRRLARAQEAFGRTGALHAAALFDARGAMRTCREDVGRHNAVDKAIGRCLMDGTRFDDAILLVSGRTSFEILQKAAVVGIPIVCAISGPTSLAIDTAREFNITLVNFLRGRGMNLSSAPRRIVGPPRPAGPGRRRRTAGGAIRVQ